MLTKKDVLQLTSGEIYSIGYHQAEYLLNYSRKVGYNVGVRGYNYDVYIVGDDVIITGHRPFKTKTISYELLKEYEKIARETQYQGWKDAPKTTNNLLLELLRVNKEMESKK